MSSSRGVVAGLLLLGAGAWACTTSDGVVATPGMDAGVAVEADGNVPFVAKAPWTSTSARVELTSFGFFDGSMGYAKDRAALTAVQLQALEGLRTRQVEAGQGVYEDVEAFTITIVDADGTRATYRATRQNFNVREIAVGSETIDMLTLEPFLATFACMKARATRGCLAAPGAVVPADCRASVSTDPACSNGVFVGDECADIWIKLVIASAGGYEVAAGNCVESIAIKLLGTDGATVLASSAAGPAPTCSSVTHAFDAPGTYWLILEKRNAAGCPGVGGAGDFNLRVSPQP